MRPPSVPSSRRTAPSADTTVDDAPASSLRPSGVGTVALLAARIPGIGRWAWHHWLVVEDARGLDRWEIWQWRRAGGTAWGHLHLNLLPPLQGVGAGPGWVIRRWSGGPAEHLRHRLEASPREYPFREYYRPWPGPNSNTYAQWVLGNLHQLDQHAPGRAYVTHAVVPTPWV